MPIKKQIIPNYIGQERDQEQYPCCLGNRFRPKIRQENTVTDHDGGPRYTENPTRGRPGRFVQLLIPIGGGALAHQPATQSKASKINQGKDKKQAQMLHLNGDVHLQPGLGFPFDDCQSLHEVHDALVFALLVNLVQFQNEVFQFSGSVNPVIRGSQGYFTLLEF